MFSPHPKSRSPEGAKAEFSSPAWHADMQSFRVGIPEQWQGVHNIGFRTDKKPQLCGECAWRLLRYKRPVNRVKQVNSFASSKFTTQANMLKHIQFAGEVPQVNLAMTLQICAILGLGYCILATLFNLFLHPIRQVPGPFWARCSNLWGRYQNLYGQKAHRVHAAHKAYGELISDPPHDDTNFNGSGCADCT